MIEKEKVIELYTQLDKLGVPIWIDGGWGVDALLGKQTRPHSDLDIVIQEKHLLDVRRFLESRGYMDIQRDDTKDWNFVLGDNNGHAIDLHVIVFDDDGNGIYGPVENDVFYPAKSLLGKGTIDDVVVRCLTPEYQVESHTGYKPSEKDFKDVSALCERFNLKYPKGYQRISIPRN